MKGIYEFYWDCGRSGDLEGIFIADSDAVAAIIGEEVCFGECLGKHSEVYGRIKEGDITLKTDDQDFIKIFEEIMGEGWGSGYNPFDYYEATEEESEE